MQLTVEPDHAAVPPGLSLGCCAYTDQHAAPQMCHSKDTCNSTSVLNASYQAHLVQHSICLQDQDAEQPREAAGDVKVEDADQS